MATATWGALGTQVTLASTALNSLANAASSGFLTTFDNTTVAALYAVLELDLASLAVASGGSITIRQFAAVGSFAPDDSSLVGGGEPTIIPLVASTSAKKASAVIRLLGAFPIKFALVNNAGVALAASSNTLKLQPFGESIA